jgi:GTP pyrophosphokinase
MQAISQSGTNVKAAELSTRDGTVFSTIVVEVDNRAHLAKVIKAVRKVKGITDVERRDVPAPH